MLTSESLLRTETSDLRKPEMWSRGSRYWSQAEVKSDALFIVEGCQVATEFVGEVPMCFVTPNILEVQRICQAWSLKRVRVMIYARTPEEHGPGYTFGQVSEAFGSQQTGSVFIKLESGSALVFQAKQGSQSANVVRRLFPGSNVWRPVPSRGHDDEAL
jgi:hypothetical protein